MGSTAEFLSEGGASRLSLGVIRRDLLKTAMAVLLPEARALGDDRDDPPTVSPPAGSADAAAAKAFAARHASRASARDGLLRRRRSRPARPASA